MMNYIGYVSTPFGKHNGTDFTELYNNAIFPSRNVAPGGANIFLFREDADRPPWEPRHKHRIERFRGGHNNPPEVQLYEHIQANIVASDFVIAVLTEFNRNVMLEVGFAQGQRKPIIYVLQGSQIDQMPANLRYLKPLLYDSSETLKFNLYFKIKEVAEELEGEYEHPGIGAPLRLDYYPNRRAIGLSEKLRRATKRIQILTTNLTTVSADYIDSIVSAVSSNPSLVVRILTSDPENHFIDPRAHQLVQDTKGYKMELQGSLESIRAELRKYQNCEIRTYKDFPLQLWHLIDDYIYVGQVSLVRRSRWNCVFGIGIDTPGVSETFLEHFDRLWEKAAPPGHRKSQGGPEAEPVSCGASAEH
jgi:hypothetical protein